MALSEALEPVRSALERAGIRYAVGGSWASTAFGERRFTNDVDILAEFTQENVKSFLDNLPDTFYVDAEQALAPIRRGRPFNVIYIPLAFKFDFFAAGSFTLGREELDASFICQLRVFQTRPHRLSRQRTFCLRNCIGSGWAVKCSRYSGAISKALLEGAPLLLIGYIYRKAPQS